MSHVLLTGDPDRYPGLPALLRGWGMTVGSMTGRKQDAFPALGECDLVIHVCPDATDPGAMPDGAQAAGGAARVAAPLLVLGSPSGAPGACATVPEPGPEGILLRAALAHCLAQGRMRREEIENSRQEHLQFLGHELRTPLAAIKTALDVLAREEGFDGAVGRMLDIACRNVDRLTGTVEWSQDLIELDETPPDAHLEEVPLAALAGQLRKAGWKVSTLADSSRAVLTDPGLLVQLLGQLGRVMDSVYPGEGRVLSLESAGDEPGIRLTLLTEGEAQPVPGLQQGRPTGLEPGTPCAGSPVQRLIDVMTAPYLREVLGVRPRATGTVAGLRGVGFDLPEPLPVPTS